MKSLTSKALFLALAGTAYGHTIFQEMYVNGVSQGHLVGIRYPDYNGPITDVDSNDVICNGGINPYHTPMSQTVMTVPAGAQVSAEWHHGLNGPDPSDPADPVDPSHKGPMLAYLAKVPSALQTTVTGLQWFKIWQDGWDAATNTWGVDRMIANKGKVTFTIPSCIAAGDYLLRVELIALHGASSYPGAQLYMECAQIRITGGGNTSPATVSFPGAYKGTDPGILLSIYWPPLTSYTIPGPAVFSCSGGGNTDSGSTTSVTTTSKVTTSTTSTTTTTSKTSTTTGPAPSGSASQWAQCGGTGWTGATACVSPYKCVVVNDYYSQCQ